MKKQEMGQFVRLSGSITHGAIRKALGLVLCLCTLLNLLPTVAMAANTTGAETLAQELNTIVDNSCSVDISTKTVMLTKDITLTGTISITSGTMSLDLAGHTITGKAGDDGEAGYTALSVSGAAILTIMDSSTGGAIVGGEGASAPNMDDNAEPGGNGIEISSATVTITGGTFTGGDGGMSGDGTSGDGGNGITVSDSTVTITGGTLNGGCCGRGGSCGDGGKGLKVSSGNVTIEGGTFTGATDGNPGRAISAVSISALIADGYAAYNNAAKPAMITGDANLARTTYIQIKPISNAVTPVITAQPGSHTYKPGDAVIPLTVVASVTDGGTLTYQWYSNSTNSTAGGTAISGAKNASYIPSVTAVGTTYYYCIVTNTNNRFSGTKVAAAVTDIVYYNVTMTIADEIARILTAVNRYDLSTVKSSDKENINKLITDIDALVDTGNLTEAEKTALDSINAKAEALIRKIDDAAAVTNLLLTDLPTGTVVQALEETTFDANLRLVVTRVNPTEKQTSGIKLVASDKDVVSMVDIFLMRGEKTVQPNGMVKITLTLTEEQLANYKDFQIVNVDDNGNAKIFESKLNGNRISFFTDRLCGCGVIATRKIAQSSTPPTGGNNNTPLWIVLLFITAGVLTTMAITKDYEGQAANKHR